jgi:predicted transcriptional regulator
MPMIHSVANRKSPTTLNPPILPRPLHLLTAAMKVHFTPKQEAELSEIASHAGIDTEHLVKKAALRLLERDAGFWAAVRKGLDQADRGDFADQHEMGARIERMIQA